jgi:hypothetical protein
LRFLCGCPLEAVEFVALETVKSSTVSYRYVHV